MDKLIRIGLLLFPSITQLDLTGPAEVFSRVEEAEVHFVWKSLEPVKTSAGWDITPTTTFANSPQFDVICVPGGSGQISLMNDEETIEFLRKQSIGARYITSVCTGSLLLGAAGLLVGYRAACHWMSLEQLTYLGAIPVAERIVRDRNRITGGGVTAGIDFALAMVSELCGSERAKKIQLDIEYAPDPPFNDGYPDQASPELVLWAKNKAKDRQDKRLIATKAAAKRLSSEGDVSEISKQIQLSMISDGHQIIRLSNSDNISLYTEEIFRERAIFLPLDYWNHTIIESLRRKSSENISTKLVSATMRAHKNSGSYEGMKPGDLQIASEILFEPSLFKPNEQHLSRTQVYSRIKELYKLKKPIRLALPVFSRKPVCPLKNRGHLPDLAEIVTLSRCYEVAALLELVYPFGVEFTAYADGNKYRRACGTPHELIQDYQDGLVYWSQQLDITTLVRIVDYESELVKILGRDLISERESQYEQKTHEIKKHFDQLFNPVDLSESLRRVEKQSQNLCYTFRSMLTTVYYQTGLLSDRIKDHEDTAERYYFDYIKSLQENLKNRDDWREPFCSEEVINMRWEAWNAAIRYVSISYTDRTINVWESLNPDGFKLTIHGKENEIHFVSTSKEYISYVSQHVVGGIEPDNTNGIRVTFDYRLSREGTNHHPLLFLPEEGNHPPTIEKMCILQQPICYTSPMILNPFLALSNYLVSP
jgi:putative intracellular protease/amidase